jgi:hypothetical protein
MTSIGLKKWRSPRFPSEEKSSIHFYIHSDYTNQQKSNLNDGTVNDHQVKPSCTLDGLQHSDPLQVPHTDIHQSNTPNCQVAKHNVRTRLTRTCPPRTAEWAMFTLVSSQPASMYRWIFTVFNNTNHSTNILSSTTKYAGDRCSILPWEDFIGLKLADFIYKIRGPDTVF